MALPYILYFSVFHFIFGNYLLLAVCQHPVRSCSTIILLLRDCFYSFENFSFAAEQCGTHLKCGLEGAERMRNKLVTAVFV